VLRAMPFFVVFAKVPRLFFCACFVPVFLGVPRFGGPMWPLRRPSEFAATEDGSLRLGGLAPPALLAEACDGDFCWAANSRFAIAMTRRGKPPGWGFMLALVACAATGRARVSCCELRLGRAALRCLMQREPGIVGGVSLFMAAGPPPGDSEWSVKPLA